MNFKIRGRQYELNQHDVLDAVRNVTPAISDSRHKYFVRLDGRTYPIKQVLQLVTRLPVAEFTAHTAYRVLSALGFEILEREALEQEYVVGTDSGGQLVDLLVTFETDEDGWVVASCPSLPGCHSQGRTRAEAPANIREAISGYLASMREHDAPMPSSTDYELVKVKV